MPKISLIDITQKMQKMSATRHPPFDATLRPTSKSRGAVLAALTMAPLDFEVGFGNIFLLSTMEFHNGKSQVW